MEAIGSLIGGIGVFFVGLFLLSSGLKQMAGRRFRMQFARWLGTALRTGLAGFMAGFLSQSMPALSFITGSLVSAGLLPVQRGILLIFWANAGAGIMIVLAVLNIKLAVLFILGVSGLSFAFKRPRRMALVSQALFGGSMLFYGLIMLRAGAEPLAAMPWFKTMLMSHQSSYLYSFLIGALLTGLCQSSTAVSILAIALAQVGVFSLEQTMMIIYGTNVGSGAVTWLLGMTIRGTPKQLIMSQVFFNLITGAVFVLLFYLELFAGLPLVHALILHLHLPLEQKAAMVFLVFNWGGAVVMSLALMPFVGALARFWPATQEEEWSRTAFLRDDFGGAPELHLGLLVKEQARLMCRMPRYPAMLLEPAPDQAGTLDALNGSFKTVSGEINAQIEELVRQPLSHSGVDLLMILQNKQKLMEGLEALLYQFNQLCRQWSGSLRKTFEDSFVQSLDFLLNTLCETETSGDLTDAENFIHLTGNKGDVIQSIRAAYISRQDDLSASDRAMLLELTGVFERIVWTLGRIAGLQGAQKKLDG